MHDDDNSLLAPLEEGKQLGRPVNRRALAKGMAWTVPAVVVAAGTPALAASCSGEVCTRYTLSWNPASGAKGEYVRSPAKSITRYRWTTKESGYFTGTVTEEANSAVARLSLSTDGVRSSGASTLTLDISTKLVGNMHYGGYHLNSGYDPYNDNLCVDTTAGSKTYGLFRLHQQVRKPLPSDPLSNGQARPKGTEAASYDNPYNASTGSYQDRQEITFKFSEPVCSCSFTIYDIDGSSTTFADSKGAPFISGDNSLTNDFRDAIAILDAVDAGGNPTEAVFTSRGDHLVGSGLSSADPIRQNEKSSSTSLGYYNENPATGADAAVTVAFPQGVRQFTLHYWNALPKDANGYDAYDGDQGIFIGPMTVGVVEKVC